MKYHLEPAALFRDQLISLLSKDDESKWFKTDLAFTNDILKDQTVDIWKKDDFVAVKDKEVVAYFASNWESSIVTSFKMIVFDTSKLFPLLNALFEYFDYLFDARECLTFNFCVAQNNVYAMNKYNKFASKYFGHVVKKQPDGMDTVFYAVTKDEFYAWKDKRNKKMAS